MIEEVIDGLTNSVVEVATERKCATDVRRVELAEVAEFFRQSQDELQLLSVNELNPAPRNLPTDPLRDESVPMAAKV